MLTFLHHTAKIQFGDSFFVGEGNCLCQNRTVFGNQIVPGKSHIGCAFSVACIGIQISAQKTSTLPADEFPTVRSFPDGFIAGVENMEQAPNAPFYAEVKTELGRTYQKLLLDPSLDVAAEVKACGEAIQNIIDNNT